MFQVGSVCMASSEGANSCTELLVTIEAMYTTVCVHRRSTNPSCWSRFLCSSTGIMLSQQSPFRRHRI